MERQSEDIFLMVNDQVIRKVLDGLMNAHHPLTLRRSDKSTMNPILRAHTIRSLSLDFGVPTVFKRDEEVTLHFQSQGEKYFCKATLNGWLKENLVSFVLSSDVYRVQRRANFRLVIPESEEYKLELYDPDHDDFLGIYTIKDISAGGCRIYFTEAFPERLRSMKVMKGTLKVAGVKLLEVPCEVRHIQDSKVTIDPDDKEAGIQFVIEDPKVEQSLLSLVFELQRKLVQTDL